MPSILSFLNTARKIITVAGITAAITCQQNRRRQKLSAGFYLFMYNPLRHLNIGVLLFPTLLNTYHLTVFKCQET